MTKYLIFNADDFGMSEPVNLAVIDAANNGLVRSTTALTNMDGFHVGEYALVANKEKIATGVHLNFSNGTPISMAEDVPTLVGVSGQFLDPSLASDHMTKVDPGQLKQEFSRQIEKIVDLGLVPSHLDNHRPEIYLYPNLFKVVVELASDYKLPIRSPFGNDFQEKCETLAGVYKIDTDQLRKINLSIKDMLKRDGVGTTHYFCFEFTKIWQTPEKVCEYIELIPEGVVEFCAHPSTFGEREIKDYNLLTDQKLIEYISSQDDIFVGNYREFKDELMK